LKEDDPFEDFQMKYRGIYYSVLMDFINLNKKDIEEQGLKMNELFKELWPFFLEEARIRSKEYYDLSHEKKLFGENLWFVIPKGISELKIISEKLSLIGVVDRVENFVPIEIKTGKAPRDGVWKENMVQLGAYMLLLSEHYGCEVNEGYVEYRTVNERRKVTMNPFLKDKIMELIIKVKETLNSSEKPLRVNEEWKCKMCGIREDCFSSG
jgi:CRISPR-associated protein Cas4